MSFLFSAQCDAGWSGCASKAFRHNFPFFKFPLNFLFILGRNDLWVSPNYLNSVGTHSSLGILLTTEIFQAMMKNWINHYRKCRHPFAFSVFPGVRLLRLFCCFVVQLQVISKLTSENLNPKLICSNRQNSIFQLDVSTGGAGRGSALTNERRSECPIYWISFILGCCQLLSHSGMRKLSDGWGMGVESSWVELRWIWQMWMV